MLKPLIEAFVKKPSNYNFNRIVKKIILTSNEASIVFSYSSFDSKALFTGDANKKVFNRLIRNKANLKSDIIKIPHHGSKYNTSKKLLEYVQPKWAIVSHNNGKFGKQQDPHPNYEIINMLQELGISTLYTNDVIKNGNTLIHRPPTNQFSSNIEYYSN